ncbi:MAG: hypothetical protein KDE31_17285, partial [Caldilineaceae bacterium]|nr:hypothetical protein [Caldilineaceae bacterium]
LQRKSLQGRKPPTPHSTELATVMQSQRVSVSKEGDGGHTANGKSAFCRNNSTAGSVASMFWPIQPTEIIGYV